MRSNLKQKKLLIYGLIAFLCLGIILPIKWNYFILNKHKNNFNINSFNSTNEKNSIYLDYLQEEKSIIFQIDIIKGALRSNNNMYQRYNSILKHNINYVYKQKNIIRNRIEIANNSITHELNILYIMKSIIINHSYNYLQFFKSKNYILPKMISKNKINNYQNLINIRTHTQKLNKSYVSIQNISYQSEEYIIGAKYIYNTVSSLKMLIFSKIHFDNNNVYYFSDKLNDLTTIGKLINISSEKKYNPTTSKFLTKKINDKNIKHVRNDVYLNKYLLDGKISNYIKAHKVPIIIGSAILFLGFSGALIGVSICIYIIYKNKQRAEINIKNAEERVNMGTNTESIPATENTVVQLGKNSISQKNKKVESKCIATKRKSEVEQVRMLIGKHESVREKNSPSSEKRRWLQELKMKETETSVYEWLEASVYGTDIPSKHRYSVNDKHLNMRLYDEADDAYNENMKYSYGVAQKNKEYKRSWNSIEDSSDKVDERAEYFIQSLYYNLMNKNVISFDEYRMQLIHYACVKKQSKRVNFKFDYRYLEYCIKRDIKKTSSNESHTIWLEEETDINTSLITRITKFKRFRASVIPTKIVTKNGWFRRPSFNLKENKQLTEEEMLFIEKQIHCFNNLLESIPETITLRGENTIYDITSYQILQDLRELINIYTNHLKTFHLDYDIQTERRDSLDGEISSETRISNFMEKFKKTRLAKIKIADIGHLGIDEAQLSEKLYDISYLIHVI